MNVYNFTVKRGDTYNGATFEVLKNGSPLDITNAKIKADFCIGNIAYLQMSTENLKIEITDSINGKFKFIEQIISINSGVYKYDIQIEFESGVIKTYISGVMNVTKDITK